MNINLMWAILIILEVLLFIVPFVAFPLIVIYFIYLFATMMRSRHDSL